MINSELMGLGMSGPLASRVGYPIPASVAGTGTTQSGATLLGGSSSLLVPASGQTAYILSATAPRCKLHFLFNPTAVAALVYPPVGGSFNGGAANAAFTVPANSFSVATCAVLGSASQWFAK